MRNLCGVQVLHRRWSDRRVHSRVPDILSSGTLWFPYRIWLFLGYPSLNDDSELVTKILNNYALIKPINALPSSIRSASSASFRLKDPLRRDPIIKSIFFILCLFFMDWPLLSASVNSDKAKVTFWFRISLAVHKTVVFTLLSKLLLCILKDVYICIIICAEIIIYNTRPFFLCKLFDSMSYKYG